MLDDLESLLRQIKNSHRELTGVAADGTKYTYCGECQEWPCAAWKLAEAMDKLVVWDVYHAHYDEYNSLGLFLTQKDAEAYAALRKEQDDHVYVDAQAVHQVGDVPVSAELWRQNAYLLRDGWDVGYGPLAKDMSEMSLLEPLSAFPAAVRPDFDRDSFDSKTGRYKRIKGWWINALSRDKDKLQKIIEAEVEKLKHDNA